MFPANSPTLILGLLSGGVALLLYGVRLVTDAVQRATDARIQRLLAHLVRHPFAAFGVGMLATALMQSSSAMSSLLVELVSADLIPLATAIILLLGANVGSTLIVQLLALHITNYALELLGLGTIVALLTRNTSFRRLGQACFAFGLIVLGLAALSQSSQPIAASPLTATILKTLVGAPIVLLLIGAVLTMLLSSSAAFIGLVLALTVTGALPVMASLALMLGANVGTTLVPLMASLRPGMLAGRRLALVHTGTKLAGALTFLLLLGPLTNMLARIWSNPGTQVAMAHLGFNLALALVFGFLVTPLAYGMKKIVPEPKGSQNNPCLDTRSLRRPAVALGQASREILRMAGLVMEMLECSMDTFADETRDLYADVDALYIQLNKLNVSVKAYLTQLDKKRMTAAQVHRHLALLSIITDLSAIGRAVAMRFMNLARHKHRGELFFSDRGREDLLAYHEEILEAFQQILAVLATHDLELVATFLARKRERSRLGRELYLSYVHRLYTENALSQVSISHHLNLLNTMGEVLSHITSIASAFQMNSDTSQNRITTGPPPAVPLVTQKSQFKRPVPARALGNSAALPTPTDYATRDGRKPLANMHINTLPF